MQIKTKLKSILDRDGFVRVRNVLNFNKDLKPILNDMEYVMDNLVHKFAPVHMKEKIQGWNVSDWRDAVSYALTEDNIFIVNG